MSNRLLRLKADANRSAHTLVLLQRRPLLHQVGDMNDYEQPATLCGATIRKLMMSDSEAVH
jgi:hypothetical protein